jgi:ligand-binding sensor domain-containing protein/two-component sensor histidine kinase
MTLPLLLMLCGAVYAQEETPENQFGHLALEEGLSHDTITCMVQDQKGFLWFGTYRGLNKYDGYTFTVYPDNRPDSRPPVVNSLLVVSLYEDRTGILWIGTGDGGLIKFDRETLQWKSYQHNPAQPNSLSHNIVLTIYEDRRGELWVGTADGLNRFDRHTEQFFQYHAAPDDPESLANDQIQTIYEDQTGTLWIGTLNGLYQFNRDTTKFRRYLSDPENPHSIGDHQIKALYEDHTGTLWVGTNGGGLNRFNRATGQFVHYRHNPDDPQSLSDDRVRTIYEDHTQTLWVGTTDGLNKFNHETGQFTVYRPEQNNPYSLSDSDITSLYEDRSGLLWIGTFHGALNTYSPETKQFLLYTHEPDNPQSLSSSDVTAIYADQSGMLWVGTNGRGLDQLDRQTGHVTHYQTDTAYPESLSNAQVEAIYEDRSGSLWIGTRGGLNQLDHERARFRHYTHDPENPASLSHDVVSAIVQVRSGTLWIGTGGGGLNQFDPDTEHFTPYRHDPADSSSLSHDDIVCLHEDRFGNLWIGTSGGGLNVFEPQQKGFRHYRHDPADPSSLSHDVVLTMYEDRFGTLWMGTNRGLDQFDRKTETFTHYGKKDGLPSNLVVGILEDGQGNLWLSTFNGLSKFNPETGTFTNFDVSDGLQSNKFNRACAQSWDDVMFFGGVQGVNAFYPEQIKDTRWLPAVVMTALTQNGEPLFGDKPMESIGEIRIDWRHNFFEFEFAALSYIQPAKNQYAYLLKGFDRDWNYIGTRRFGKYLNLPGGKYTLRIKGSTNEGIWNEEGTSIQVSIADPPWKTWWAYGLYVTIPLIALLSYTRYTLKRRQLEESIRLIVEGTVAEIGEEFFRSLARNLASALHVRFVLVSEFLDSPATKARTLAFWTGSAFAENFTYDLERELYQTDQEHVWCYYPQKAHILFADDELITATGAESYIRIPLAALSGTVIGHLIIMHDRPLKDKTLTFSVLKIFAARAEVEVARNRANNELKASLREKEILLKEIHHRVKNNLQIMSSLLGMQMGALQDQSLVKIFRESQNRIKSMALIHEKLYHSPNLAEIDFQQYIQELGTSLFATYGVKSEEITLAIRANNVWLPIDAAIPCGMILNELISNALKHAFSTGKSGEITIDIVANDRHEVMVIVRDTGVGLSEGIDIYTTPSLGLKLVRLFTEQLGGAIQVARAGGTAFTLTFPKYQQP